MYPDGNYLSRQDKSLLTNNFLDLPVGPFVATDSLSMAQHRTNSLFSSQSALSLSQDMPCSSPEDQLSQSAPHSSSMWNAGDNSLLQACAGMQNASSLHRQALDAPFAQARHSEPIDALLQLVQTSANTNLVSHQPITPSCSQAAGHFGLATTDSSSLQLPQYSTMLATTGASPLQTYSQSFGSTVSSLASLASLSPPPIVSQLDNLNLLAISAQDTLPVTLTSESPFDLGSFQTSEPMSDTLTASPSLPSSVSSPAVVKPVEAPKTSGRRVLDLSAMSPIQAARIMRRRLRNKAAATKCRQKTKEKALSINQELTRSADEVSALRNAVQKLEIQKEKLIELFQMHCSDINLDAELDLSAPTEVSSPSSPNGSDLSEYDQASKQQ